MASSYPVDVRADQPARSSRLWAILTIIWIKFLALIPHFICLAVLGIAQAIVAIIGQIMVAVTGRYPEAMYDFVAGVVRWNARVSAFVLSLTDRYPPFALKAIPDYPVDVEIRRPERPSRGYAIATLIVQVLMIAAIVGAATSGDNGSGSYQIDANTPSSLGTLYLRILAAIPHLIIVAALGFAAFWVWVVMQWVILIIGRYPESLHGFTAGVLRWAIRVNMYTLGLRDDYPPFTMQPSMTSAVPGPPPQGNGTWVEPGWPGGPAGGGLPPAPPYGGAPAVPPPPAPPAVPPATPSSGPGTPYMPAPSETTGQTPATPAAETPPPATGTAPVAQTPPPTQTAAPATAGQTPAASPQPPADPTKILTQPPVLPPPAPQAPSAPPTPPILPPGA